MKYNKSTLAAINEIISSVIFELLNEFSFKTNPELPVHSLTYIQLVVGFRVFFIEIVLGFFVFFEESVKSFIRKEVWI